jgi:uncharacterized repeat protein (TIGR01451 family)
MDCDEATDPDCGNNSVTITTAATQTAELALTKVAANETPAAGDPQGARYTITLVNNGPSDATDVVLTDQIPDGTTLIKPVENGPQPVVTEPPITCTTSPTAVTCPIDDFPAGASQTLIVTIDIPASTVPGPLANTATAMTTTGEPDPPPVTAAATVDVAVVADLVITKTIADPAPPNPIVAGQPVVYEISVTNNGPSDAPDILFSDTIPEETTLIPQRPPEPLTCAAEPEDDLVIVSCTAPLLRVGDTIRGPLTISVPPDRIEDVANTASIGSGALDRELLRAGSQNEATAIGEVVPPAPIPPPADPPPTSVPSPAPMPSPAPAPTPQPVTGSGSGTVAATGMAIGALAIIGLALVTAGGVARLAGGRRRRRRPPGY